jgi:hypothetical protein
MSGSLVMTPIIPAKFNEAAFWEVIASAARDVSKEIKKDFEKTTKTWKMKVKFEELIEVGPKEVTIFVGTDNEIYGFVDKGTKPHPIVAKTDKGLMFRSGYTGAKTKPGVIGSVNRGPATGAWVKKMIVHHPGTEARGFSDTIQEKWQGILPKRMQKAIDLAAKVSGHGM